MRLSSKMSLTLWDDFVNDRYSAQQLLDNWLKVDFHDHSPGRGVQIARGGIAAGAVGPNQLGTDIPWVPMQGTFALRPDPGVFGRLYYATDQDTWYGDTGVQWDQLGGGTPLSIRAAQAPLLSSFGTTAVTWPGGSQVSNVITVTHDLGRTPQWVLATTSAAGISSNPFYTWVNTYTSTTFHGHAHASAGNVAAGTYGQFDWVAIG